MTTDEERIERRKRKVKETKRKKIWGKREREKWDKRGG